MHPPLTVIIPKKRQLPNQCAAVQDAGQHTPTGHTPHPQVPPGAIVPCGHPWQGEGVPLQVAARLAPEGLVQARAKSLSSFAEKALRTPVMQCGLRTCHGVMRHTKRCGTRRG